MINSTKCSKVLISILANNLNNIFCLYKRNMLSSTFRKPTVSNINKSVKNEKINLNKKKLLKVSSPKNLLNSRRMKKYIHEGKIKNIRSQNNIEVIEENDTKSLVMTKDKKDQNKEEDFTKLELHQFIRSREEKVLKGDYLLQIIHENLKDFDNVQVNSLKPYKGMNMFNIQPLKEINQPLIPFTPRLGPFKIVNPGSGLKSYYWCSCGMSSKQPFCNRMHIGTGFIPIKFSLDEFREEIFLCGCKLSKLSPFCDGQTCVNSKLTNPNIIKDKTQPSTESESGTTNRNDKKNQ